MLWPFTRSSQNARNWCRRMAMNYEIVRLKPDTELKGFDCGNEDINNFLVEDSIDYQNGLLAVTYLAVADNRILSYFCLLNDKLAYLPGDDKTSWNRLNRKINNHKRLKSYPAVKIGRLGTIQLHHVLLQMQLTQSLSNHRARDNQRNMHNTSLFGHKSYVTVM